MSVVFTAHKELASLMKHKGHLQKNLPDGSIDPEQIWMVNNQIVFSDDNFKTSRSAIGKLHVEGNTYYGLISEMVLSGYIEGSHMRGGDIYIGRQDDNTYAFQVENNGDFNFGGKNGIVYNSTNKQMTFGSDVSLTWDQITGTDDIATTGDIPNVSDKLKEYLNSDNIGTYITKDAISTLGLAVGEEILMGENAKISWDNLPTDIATTGDISDSLQGYLNQDNYSTYITKDWIGTLGLTVGKEILMGPDAKISWSQISDVPDIDISDQLDGYLNKDNFSTVINKDWIGTLGLAVGDQIKMGPNATISWNNVTDTSSVATVDYVNQQVDNIEGVTLPSYITATKITKTTIESPTITGAYIESQSGKIGPFELSDSGFHATKVTTAGIYLPYKIGTYGGYIQIGAYPDESNWDDPIVINGYEAGWCVMRHDGMRVGGKYEIASTYQDDCLIAGELNVVNGATIDGGTLIKQGAIIHGGAIINDGAYISGTLTANNVDIGAYALLGGPGSVAIINPNSTTNGEVYFGVNKADSASNSTSYLRGRNVRIYSHNKGGVYLGSSGSTAITSDEKLKNIFDIDDRYESFFNNINPVAYQYKVGHRTHLGFGARAIENALQDANLTTEEFAGILIDRDVSVGEDEIMSPDGATHFDEIYSLRYEEFIALNTYMIKKQQRIIEDLTHRIESIENTLIETKGK